MRNLPPELLSALHAMSTTPTTSALVAEVFVDGRETVVAEARYAPAGRPVGRRSSRCPWPSQWQGKGLASLLLNKLLCHAATAGIERVVGETLANQRRHAAPRPQGRLHRDAQRRRARPDAARQGARTRAGPAPLRRRRRPGVHGRTEAGCANDERNGSASARQAATLPLLSAEAAWRPSARHDRCRSRLTTPGRFRLRRRESGAQTACPLR